MSSGSARCVRKAVRTAPCGASAVNHKQQNASVMNEVPDGCAAQRLQAFSLVSSTTCGRPAALSLEHPRVPIQDGRAGADDLYLKRRRRRRAPRA